MQLPPRRARGALHAPRSAPVLALLAALVIAFMSTLAGCGPSEPPRPAQRKPLVQDGAGAAMLPDLMDLLVDPAAGVLLAAADMEADGAAEPRAAEAWQAVADAAAQLVRSSATLAHPALALDRAEWLQFAAALGASAAAGGAAAVRHDAGGLAEAAAHVRSACRACHERFVPVAFEASTPPRPAR